MAGWLEQTRSQLATAAAGMLALLSAFQTVLTFPMWVQISITLFLGFLFVLSISQHLRQIIAPKNTVGFRQPKEGNRWYLKPVLAIVLVIPCALLVFICHVQIERNSLQLLQTDNANLTEWVLVAPSRPVDEVSVSMRNQVRSVCSWGNVQSVDFPPLKAATVDWDLPTRQLIIQNFERPQRILIRCLPGDSSAIQVSRTPVTVEVLTAPQIRFLKLIATFVGVLSWLVAVFRLLT